MNSVTFDNLILTKLNYWNGISKLTPLTDVTLLIK